MKRRAAQAVLVRRAFDDLMLTADQQARYLRHILLREVGAQGQQRLLSARVLIVGLGGLGSPILQYLAGAGVGTIGVCDDDHIEISNLQRQVLFSAAQIGEPKTTAAIEAATRLNPHIQYNEHQERLAASNAASLFSGYDLIVEGVDSFAARYVINEAAITARKPLVSAAVGRFDGQVALFKPFAAPGALPCYRCFTPQAPPRDDGANCAEQGVLGPLLGVVGAMAALEVIKELVDFGESLAGRLFVFNGLTAQARTITLPADPSCPDCSGLTPLSSASP